jgi:hypothetical protein
MYVEARRAQAAAAAREFVQRALLEKGGVGALRYVEAAAD